MKKISSKYPIYIHPRLKGVIPENAVYMIAPSLKDLPLYIGNSRDVIKRYARYERAIKNPASESHESSHKISEFKKHYTPSISPVMVLIDEEVNGNEREKFWRQHYEQRGAMLVNNTGKMKRHLKVTTQNVAYNLIDDIFENAGSIVLVFLVLIVLAGFCFYRMRG